MAEHETVPGQAYGTQYSCGCCDSAGGGLYRVRTEPTFWWMGLDSMGQAHYLCADCHPAYFASQPLIEGNAGVTVPGQQTFSQKTPMDAGKENP